MITLQMYPSREAQKLSGISGNIWNQTTQIQKRGQFQEGPQENVLASQICSAFIQDLVSIWISNSEAHDPVSSLR